VKEKNLENKEGNLLSDSLVQTEGQSDPSENEGLKSYQLKGRDSQEKTDAATRRKK